MTHITNAEQTTNYANRLGYSDITPCEVLRRVSGKTIEVREMKAELDPAWQPIWVVGGFMGHCSNIREQQWIITSDTERRSFRIRLDANGFWKDAGGHKYYLEESPVKFYDYNF